MYDFCFNENSVVVFLETIIEMYYTKSACAVWSGMHYFYLFLFIFLYSNIVEIWFYDFGAQFI